MEKYILSDVNKLLAGSNLYCEPLDMFIQYAKYLYSLLNNITNEDNYNIDELLKQFEINNVKISLSRKETLYVEFQITCLKQYIDYYFAKDINLLKILNSVIKLFLLLILKLNIILLSVRIKLMFIKIEQKINSSIYVLLF